MKIAIATSFPADPAVPSGGVEAVSVNLVQALAALDDLEVHVVTVGPDVKVVQERRWKGAVIHRLPRRAHTVLGSALGPDRRQVLRYLLQLAPDVVHAHDTYGLMVKGLRIPRVFTIHGFIHADTLVSGERLAALRSLVWRFVETSGWADQPHIIAISPYVRERLTGIARGVIHDIDNPIGEAFFGVPRQERKGTIFSAALVCHRKNTLGLIESFGRLRTAGVEASLRVAGSVSDVAYGHRVEERIRSLGLTGQVVLLGPLDSRQVQAELAGASVFALVSLEENAPLGIAEAMAVGVPVVTSNRCGMPYMVRHGETGFLVDPFAADDIAHRLATLLGDDAMRATMGHRSREVARERFSPAAVARRTREVYQEAAQDKPLVCPDSERC
jgi:glycosyltransferase involved in cell wall biosynthesis